MKKKVSNKIAFIIIIAIIILMLGGAYFFNYAEPVSIGTNVTASFSNGVLTIRSTEGIGTIDKSLLNTFVTGTSVGGKNNVKTITFSNQVYAPVDSSELFSNYFYLTDINHLNYLNTSNVTDMNAMFSNCTNLTQIDLSGFDTSNVKYMYHMFSTCRKLIQLDLSGFNTSSLTNYSFSDSLFKLESLNLSGFDMSNVTETIRLDIHATGLKEIYTPNNLGSNTIKLNDYFYNCDDPNDNNLYRVIDNETFTESKHLKIANVVIYDSGTGIESNVLELKKDNQNLSIRENSFSAPEGKQFVGWNTEINGKGKSYQPGDIYSDNLGIRLFPQWEDIEPSEPEEKPEIKKLSDITSDYYGEYIDFGQNIVDTNGTSDDWRILYNDKENGLLYVILADYLPNSYITDEMATNMKMKKVFDYGIVWEEGSQKDNVPETVLRNTENWQFIVPNSISEYATATGSPVYDIVQKSWREKYNIPETETIEYNRQDTTGMYFITDTHNETIFGYYLANRSYSDRYNIYGMLWYGYYSNSGSATEEYPGLANKTYQREGIRPVLAIDSNSLSVETDENGVLSVSTNAQYSVEHYVKDIDASTYTIKETENLTGTIATTVTATAKTYEGFTFDENNSQNVLSGNIEADGSLVLKVYYSRNTYTKEIKDDEGNTIGTVTGEYDEEIELPTPTREGYTFGGWYDNEEYEGNPITKIKIQEIGEKTLYIKWIPNSNTSYRIEYYLRDKDMEVEGYELDSSLTRIKTGTTNTIVSITNNDKIEIEGFTFDENNSRNVLSTNINPDGSGVMKLYYRRNISEFYIRSNKYVIGENDITKVHPETTVETFKGNIDTNGTMTVKDKDGQTLNNDALVTTASVLEVEYNGHTYTYEIVVRGDINGDGKVSLIDLSLMNQHLVSKIELTGIKAKAADVNYDGKIALLDSSLINQNLVGKIEL